MKLKIIIGSS
jgi:hypothetical protein